MTPSPSVVLPHLLTYEGGLDADTLFVGGALTSSTVYGDISGSTLGGADSISIAGNASGSYIYGGNIGNDSVSLAAGLIAGSDQR